MPHRKNRQNIFEKIPQGVRLEGGALFLPHIKSVSFKTVPRGKAVQAPRHKILRTICKANIYIDIVERVLMDNGYIQTAKAYILYRNERSRVREMNTRLMKTYEDITFSDAVDSDVKRENASFLMSI